MTDLKITEKTSLAYQKFMEEAEKHIKKIRKEWQLEEFHESCQQEYMKLFGRMSVRPLQHIRGGKPKPRYLIDRDEVWVLYKPPLWEMGGKPTQWEPKIRDQYIKNSKSKNESLDKLWNDKKSILQVWHGIVCGYHWVTNGDPNDEQTRTVRDWGFIQRLDLETDGPVIVAKTWRAQRFLQVQLKEHIFSKAYICLVHGKLENRVQYVECKFAALGGSGDFAIMVKHDHINDPFFSKQKQGWWKHREIKMAKTFFKPLAYYKKESDGSEYSLVYVNILSGITHQVRVTLKSVGHPLVSDDRYLPSAVAIADADWCPRNFLVEVRSDWFDMCGPFEDRKRRAYTRISIENPLPKLFQDILSKKLTLTERLDSTADLFVGCKYWALGDEMLMADYPKDSEYRNKVMRWGIRRGIHLDAMDRLLLLSREEIDRLMSEYKPPAEDEATWVCPLCMSLNQKDAHSDGIHCKGSLGSDCTGTLKMSQDTKLPHGWRDYLADPTLHMLKKVNPLWLEARKQAIQRRRALWSRPPEEADGEQVSPQQEKELFEALVKDAKSGGYGFEQKDLTTKVKSLENLKMPIKVPQDSEVRRVRLPGRGTGSAWTYTLSGKERLKAASDFSCQPKFLKEPLTVETDMFPKKNAADPAEAKEDVQIIEDESNGQPEPRKRKRREDQNDKPTPESKKNRKSQDASPQTQDRKARPENTSASSKPPKPAENRPGKWLRIENSRTSYFMDADTGETRYDMPPDYQERPPVWERVASKSNPGKVYYHNTETRETRMERPLGVKILNEDSASSWDPSALFEEEDGIPWQRVESQSKPGHFYYHNPLTGENEIKPPRVKAPWQLFESKSNKGQWYYYNQDTFESTEIPPRCALPSKASQAVTTQPSPVRSTALRVPMEPPEPRPNPAQNLGATQDEQGPLPAWWVRMPSSQYPGKFYYRNTRTQESQWDRPKPPGTEAPAPVPEPAGSEWERLESSSYPGKFYFRNIHTGETKW